MNKNVIKDTRTSSNVLYKVTDYPDMSFIGGKYLIFLVKKVENFSRAVYLVTNFLSDREPLKWKLRTVSTELIERVMSFIRDDKHKEKERSHRAHFLGCLSVLVSLLNVGEEGGAVSAVNTQLLKREIQSFFPIFNEKIFEMRTDTSTLPIESDARVPHTYKMTHLKKPRRMRKMSVKRTIHDLMSPIETNVQTNTVPENDNGHKNVDISLENVIEKNASDIRAERHLLRQRSIISILKDKQKLTVKELMSFINDCGEKTLQRELYELVEKGVLKKLGAKRWSVYSFVQPLLFETGKISH